ncbi:MAG: DinB family protein [Bacteroidetes bacterium]|nr:DinB family protein [Bacteroidota bacterium]
MITAKEFLDEVIQEGETTRKFLAIIADDRFDWKPHAKSMDIKTLANHLVDIAAWPAVMLETSELNFQDMAGYNYPDENSATGLVSFFDKNLEKSIKALTAASAEDLEKTWTMRSGDDVYMKDPKRVVIRHALNQNTHHRAQLGVYLRLLNIAIPGSYGPSADEMEKMGQ